MAGDTDFIALYQELQVDAGCTLEAFKHAYRRRVGALHPDREGAHARAAQDLQSLNVLYTAAMEFHRRYGRLPGATHLGPLSGSSGPLPAQTRRTTATSAPLRESRGTSSFVLSIIVLIVIGMWISMDFAPTADLAHESGFPTPAILPTARTLVPVVNVIDLGVTAQQVRDILGEPVSGWELRWEYGPSWVAFRCGVVIDWYSSTLRPLKVANDHPPATTKWSPPRGCKD